MASDEWVLAHTLPNLLGDVELCEKSVPNYDLLGTLRTNLEVCIDKIHTGTREQMIEFDDLRIRAEEILKRH